MWWIYLIIGLVVAGGIGIAIFFIMKNNNKSSTTTTNSTSSVATTLKIIPGPIQLKNS